MYIDFPLLILQYVMIVLNGGVPIAFAGTEEPAAYGELISIGGLGPSVNGKLSSTIAEILQTKLSIDGSRFYIKFYDVQVHNYFFVIAKFGSNDFFLFSVRNAYLEVKAYCGCKVCCCKHAIIELLCLFNRACSFISTWTRTSTWIFCHRKRKKVKVKVTEPLQINKLD